MEWLRESWLDTLALTEDWIRSKEYREDIEMGVTKARKLKFLKEDAHNKAVEADMRYGMEDDELWDYIKLAALRRVIADEKLTLKDITAIQNYVDQTYTQ